MRITKRQLRRIIREESKGSTKKYDDDSALRGKQSKLPDSLQRSIIDKTVEDREEREEEEKNESFRITKRQLRRIIREEKARLLAETETGDYMDAKVAAANYLDRPRGGGDPRVDEYVKLIKELGPRSFALGLVRAFGDMSGHPGGHESIIRYIRENL